MRNWASTHIIMDLYNINSKNDFTKKKKKEEEEEEINSINIFFSSWVGLTFGYLHWLTCKFKGKKSLEEV